jgi:hypothetical protein
VHFPPFNVILSSNVSFCTFHTSETIPDFLHILASYEERIAKGKTKPANNFEWIMDGTYEAQCLPASWCKLCDSIIQVCPDDFIFSFTSVDMFADLSK